MSNTNIAIILGTRPETIKLSPVIRECERRGISYVTVHTGQHYSKELDAIFFKKLELPEPEYELDIGSGTHGEQTGEMIVAIEEVLLDLEPDFVLVQGDTNSVLSGAIATSKLDAQLGHVEAGLRSFDWEMPEETNRLLTDHVGEYLFAPTRESADNLRDEGIPDERIYITGNTIVDAIEQNRDIAEQRSTFLEDHGLTTDDYVLMTAHRAENVDDPDSLTGIIDGVARVGEELSSQAVYPIHPRTRDRLEEFDIDVPDVINLVDPVGFFDFLQLEVNATLIITDSGGVQEEACILGTPSVTVRTSTERPETVQVGANVLAGRDPDDIVAAARRMAVMNPDWQNPFGDGTAAEQILDILSTD